MARNRLFGLVEQSLGFSKLLVEEAPLDRHDPVVRDVTKALSKDIGAMEEELRQLIESDSLSFGFVDSPCREIIVCPPDIAVPLSISVFVRRYGAESRIDLSANGLIDSNYGLTKHQATTISYRLQKVFGDRKIVVFNSPPILGGDRTNLRTNLMRTGDFFICQDLWSASTARVWNPSPTQSYEL